MTNHALEDVARRAAESVSRRTSLLTLGGAAVSAAMVRPEIGAAKKKKGKSCKKKEKKRCNNDVAACLNTINNFCPDIECIARLTPCCRTCSANGFLICSTPSEA